MIISDKLLRELADLNENIEMIIDNKKVLNEIQLEVFLRNLEKRRYNILNEIKLYNKTTEYKRDRISSISDDYKATVEDNFVKFIGRYQYLLSKDAMYLFDDTYHIQKETKYKNIIVLVNDIKIGNEYIGTVISISKEKSGFIAQFGCAKISNFPMPTVYIQK